jgi:hypothetical protein
MNHLKLNIVMRNCMHKKTDGEASRNKISRSSATAEVKL